jgi:hypothetical protein
MQALMAWPRRSGHKHALSLGCRETIEKKSKAAAGLCEWAINIVKYYDVYVEVSGSTDGHVSWPLDQSKGSAESSNALIWRR